MSLSGKKSIPPFLLFRETGGRHLAESRLAESRLAESHLANVTSCPHINYKITNFGIKARQGNSLTTDIEKFGRVMLCLPTGWPNDFRPNDAEPGKLLLLRLSDIY